MARADRKRGISRKKCRMRRRLHRKTARKNVVGGAKAGKTPTRRVTKARSVGRRAMWVPPPNWNRDLARWMTRSDSKFHGDAIEADIVDRIGTANRELAAMPSYDNSEQLLNEYLKESKWREAAKQIYIPLRVREGENRHAFECDKCDRTFARSSVMEQHVRKVHGPRKPCSSCEMTFSNAQNLRRHISSGRCHGRQKATGRTPDKVSSMQQSQHGITDEDFIALLDSVPLPKSPRPPVSTMRIPTVK